MLRHLDLFSGIGGFALGLQWAGGFETVGFCEIDPYCRRVLAKHWPSVPIHEDVRTLDRDAIGPVDIITGGFPCQPFSTASAGRRVAIDLWPEMRRIVSEIRPAHVIAENVKPGPIDRAADDMRSDGFNVTCRRIGADDAGADHTRHRWWAIAHPHDESEFLRTINAEVAKLPALCRGLWGAANYSRVLRVPDGLPNRVDRNRALGNAIMPQKVTAIGRAIMRVTP